MTQLSLLIKPASGLCNLACRYCFYADEVKRRKETEMHVMDISTMHALIDKVLGYFKHEADIQFAFQGGEPTLAGLDWFRTFIQYMDSVKKPYHRISYAIQTNGTLLNEEWVSFLKENNFLVGISVDGPQPYHNAQRIAKDGSGTYAQVMEKIRMLKEAGIPYNVLTVLTEELSGHGEEYWQWVRDNDFTYVQLIPCLPPMEGTSPYALSPSGFFRFYDVLYPLWENDFYHGRYISVTLFDNLIPMFLGIAPSQCGYLGKCSLQYVVESDGSVYPCDFYCLNRYRMGSVNTDSLSQLTVSKAAKKFIKEPRRKSSACSDCPYMTMCGRQCKRLNVCYFDKETCGYRQFIEKYEMRMKRVAMVAGSVKDH